MKSLKGRITGYFIGLCMKREGYNTEVSNYIYTYCVGCEWMQYEIGIMHYVLCKDHKQDMKTCETIQNAYLFVTRGSYWQCWQQSLPLQHLMMRIYIHRICTHRDSSLFSHLVPYSITAHNYCLDIVMHAIIITIQDQLIDTLFIDKIRNKTLQ